MKADHIAPLRKIIKWLLIGISFYVIYLFWSQRHLVSQAAIAITRAEAATGNDHPKSIRQITSEGVLLALGVGPGLAQESTRLVGTWVYRDALRTVEIGFLPDGRYAASIKIGEATVPENGRYELKGTKLTLAPQGAAPVTYNFSLVGNKLTLSGGNYPQPLTYIKVPGSEAKIIAEASRADASKSREDAEWRSRIKVAPLNKQSVHVPVGEVPADPNQGHIFKGSTVFSSEALYLRLTPYQLRFANGSSRQVFNSWKWYFFPTGRVFVRTEEFVQGRRYDPGNPRGEIKTYWGAYRIEPGAEVDQVSVETDQGEKITMELRDGRRNLYWGNESYGHVEWEKEAVRRQVEKK